MTAAVQDTKPFSPFEWMLAGRYLRARRKEGFISVIAGFSFLGIMLGVATLIIVMAVMNGFRKDLFCEDPGPQRPRHRLQDRRAFRRLRGDGQTRSPRCRASKPPCRSSRARSWFRRARRRSAGSCAACREDELKSLPLVADNVRFGTLDGFDKQTGIAIGMRLANALRVNVGDTVTLISPRGAPTPFGTAPRSKPYMIACDLRTRHVRIRQDDDLHAARARRRNTSRKATRST